MKNQRDQFFRDLSIESNMDEKTVRQIYYSMVRMVMINVKSGGKYKMPDFGSLEYRSSKSRKIGGILMGSNTPVFSPVRSIRFTIDYKIKAFVKTWDIVDKSD